MGIDNEISKIGFEISKKRSGMPQLELEEKANITQQRISKIEAGMNCHLAKLLKVCGALNLKIEIK
jgi:transcriptional regulator with XRE-family HTH domain